MLELITAHWGIPDPAAVVAQAFDNGLRMLERRTGGFKALPMDKLDIIAIKRELDAISGSVPA